MKIFVILSAVLACAVANQYTAPAPVIKAMAALTSNGKTEVEKPVNTTTQGELAILKDLGGKAKGSHSFTGDDGKLYTINWTSDDTGSSATSSSD